MVQATQWLLACPAMITASKPRSRSMSSVCFRAIGSPPGPSNTSGPGRVMLGQGIFPLDFQDRLAAAVTPWKKIASSSAATRACRYLLHGMVGPDGQVVFAALPELLGVGNEMLLPVFKGDAQALSHAGLNFHRPTRRSSSETRVKGTGWLPFCPPERWVENCMSWWVSRVGGSRDPGRLR